VVHAADLHPNDTGNPDATARPAADTRSSLRKRLIVFSDGTGNSSAKLFKTNVWRLYEAVDLGPAPVGEPTQIAFYDDGVGTSSFKPLAVLGGALGVGLARNVRDIYAFLCRHWTPGDEIYCFGFSRGAFTIRVLTGLIQNQGIITNFVDESDLRRKVAVAYRNYRRCFEPELAAKYLVRFARAVRDGIINAIDRSLKHELYPGPPLPTDDPALPSPRNKAATITFVGLWDSVDAYGLPIDEMTRAWDKYIWPLSMRDRTPAECIQRAVHLLSLDDERNTFHPILWNERETRLQLASEVDHVDESTIAQVWFTGVHSDLGGGYPNDRLAFIPLMFMIDRVQLMPGRAVGLRLEPTKVEEYASYADLDGLMHDSRRGLAGYWRYLPRRFDLLTLLREHSAKKRRNELADLEEEGREGSNQDIPTPLIHETVLRRIEHGSQGYAPVIIPEHYKVVARRAGTHPEGLVRPQTDFPAIDPSPIQRAEKQRRLWNWVWLKRVVYFTTVFLTAWLALMPFMYRTEPTDGNNPVYGSALAAIPEFIGTFLPGFAAPWIDVWRAHPYYFLGLIVLIAAGLGIGGALAGTIHDKAQHIWRGGGGNPGFASKALDDAVFNLRTSRWYRKIFLGLKTTGLPLIFAIIFGLVGLALVSQLLLAAKEAVASSCVPSAQKVDFDEMGRAGVAENVMFDPKQLCWGSGIQLKGGRRYRLTATASPDWADSSIPADLYGLDYGKGLSRHYYRAFMLVALPLRRSIMGRWYALYARVGAQGRDVQLLSDSVRPPPRPREQRLHAEFEFTAHQNGELFLFVNDAVPVLLLYDFYGNNNGMAKIEVEQLRWDAGPPDPEK
jgi:uncharacterized protein (DUF2235 family)